MYGFVELEGENVFDSVEVPTRVLVEAIEAVSEDSRQLLKRKLQTLMDIDLIDDNTSIVIDCDGILNQDESLHILQVVFS